jgi:hypothetical protein
MKIADKIKLIQDLRMEKYRQAQEAKKNRHHILYSRLNGEVKGLNEALEILYRK